MKKSLLSLMALTLSGCSNALECSSKEVTNQVASIMRKNFYLTSLAENEARKIRNQLFIERNNDIEFLYRERDSIRTKKHEQVKSCEVELRKSDVMRPYYEELNEEFQRFKSQGLYSSPKHNFLETKIVEIQRFFASYCGSVIFDMNRKFESGSIDPVFINLGQGYFREKYSAAKFDELNLMQLKIDEFKKATEKELDGAYKKKFGELTSNLRYAFSNITTKGKDATTGRLICQADVLSSYANLNESYRFTYIVEKTSDNKAYVTLR